ncbi:MAG: hypothetical protein JWM05_2703, partial [Acidimicrobiales bacterium]|nr:hypothetical protein [Acidimicrobiales bacterium]
VFVREDEGTAESTGLNVTFGGKTLELKFSGRIAETTGPVGARTYKVTAKYAFLGGSDFGLADRGDVTALFRTGSGSSLSFDLRGRASS